MSVQVGPPLTIPQVTVGPVTRVVAGVGAPVTVGQVTVGPGAQGTATIIIHDGGGGDDMYFEQDFPNPQGDWLVRHDLGKYPNVTLIDTSGEQFFANVSFPDVNTVHVTFAGMVAGKVVCS